MKKHVVILGSAGSIGESALRVVEALPDHFQVIGIAVRRNYVRALEQARTFGIRHIAVTDDAAAAECKSKAPAGITVSAGMDGLDAMAETAAADVVLCAVVGMAGLRPVLAALRKGKHVALATKEVLVSAGSIVMDTCARHHARILPVDSEHSALFQCLEGRDPATVRSLALTASGGPFAHRHDMDFDKVTVAEALRHPRWNMGRKVTVDSATLMNKGLEIMEAHWLFSMPLDRIQVVIHPESTVHSMVELTDGSVLAQLSPPDMRFAIQYALTWPDRVDGGLPALDFSRMGPLHFAPPDEGRFPCLRLAREAGRIGGSMPAVLNAANEVAVQAFLEGKTCFSGIPRVVETVMARHTLVTSPALDDLLDADRWARQEAAKDIR